MASNRIRALQVDDTQVVAPAFGGRSLLPASADASSLRVGSTGAWEIVPAGTTLGNGVQRNAVSKRALPNLQGDLVASDAAAGIINVQNTYGSDLVVLRLEIDLTVASTGACTADFGIAATAIISDTLIDGLNLQPTPVGPFDNVDDQGTNGNSALKWPDGQYLTGSIASGAAAGLVGTYAIWLVDMN